MTDIDHLSSSADDPRVLAAEASFVEIAAAASGIVRRQLLVVGACAAIGLLCGGAYLLAAPPVFKAAGQIFLDRGNRPVVSQQPVVNEAPLDAGYFESQIEFIRSDKIAFAVVKTLDLANDPEFTSNGVFGLIVNFLRGAPPPSPAELEARAAAHLLQKLDAKRLGATFFIEIDFQSVDPATAERVLNAVVDAYIADQKEARYESSRIANAWLQQRLDELGRKAALDEQAVNAYKAKNQIVTASGGLIGEQSLSALNNELVGARAKASDALARLDRIEAVLRANNADLTVNATVSDALNSIIITKLRQDFLALTGKEAEYAARYGKGHLAVVAIHEKMKGIQHAILSELKRLAETARSEYLIARNRQKNIENELTSAVKQSQDSNQAQVALRDLESAAQSSRSLHNLFQLRYLESVQQQSMSMSDVRLIGSVAATNQKRAPKVLGIAMLGGLAAGGVLGLLREAMNRVFRTAKQTEDILKLPCVALVPTIPKGLPCDTLKTSNSGDSGQRLIADGAQMLELTRHKRLSPFSDAIRSIKLAADLATKYSVEDARPSAGGVIVGFSSSLPDEGKSTIALAFSQLTSSVGRRTIVVDCDLRNPSLSRMVSPNATVGLLEVLQDQARLEDAIWIEPTSNMAFLPFVIGAASVDAYEMLASPSANRLFDRLSKDYDYVVVDLSPMMPVGELPASVRIVDFYFFIVQWGNTRIEIVQRALKSSHAVFEKVAGIVLNKVDLREVSRYDIYGYSGYNQKYMDDTKRDQEQSSAPERRSDVG